MEQSRKNLKIMSVVVLIFAACSLVHMAAALIFNAISVSTLPAGISPDMIKLIVAGVTILLLLPQVYVGLRGLQIAKNPVATKGHIIWAVILFVLSALSIIDPIVGIVTNNNVSGNISMVLGVALELFVFYDFIKYANEVLNEAK